MGFQMPCPIQFSEDERRTHLEGADSWNKLQDYWDFVSVIMDKDGWAWHDTYEDAAAVYKIMQDLGEDAVDKIAALVSKYYVTEPDGAENPTRDEVNGLPGEKESSLPDGENKPLP